MIDEDGLKVENENQQKRERNKNFDGSNFFQKKMI